MLLKSEVNVYYYYYYLLVEWRDRLQISNKPTNTKVKPKLSTEEGYYRP